MISIDVEHYTGIHNYPFNTLWLDPNEKSFPDLPHTQQALNAEMLLQWQSVRNSIESVLYPQSLEPATCGMLSHSYFSYIVLWSIVYSDENMHLF